MSSKSQTEANRKNARKSTGPRSSAGKAACSKNRLTLGLYTHADHVKPEEHAYYTELRQTLYDQLTPAGLLEETFTAEIVSATWRLRRCASTEAELADFDPATDPTRRSIERARAAAQLALNRALAQLRKTQTERRKTHDQAVKQQQSEFDRQFDQVMADIMRPVPHSAFDSPESSEALIPEESESDPNAAGRLASNCETDRQDDRRQAFIDSWLPCPCRSGIIRRECCGKNNPPSPHNISDKAA